MLLASGTNTLTRVLDNGSEVARFTYDGLGRRATKTVGTTTTTYVYDGAQIVQERTAAGTTRQIDGLGIDEHLAAVDPSGEVTYYLTDHLGSVVQQTDASGAVTLTRQYDPYGVALQGQGTSGYAYTGREWDAETGLAYFRRRYYDPALGRFLSDDPSGVAGGINFQQYVFGNPLRFVDPFGLCGQQARLDPTKETQLEKILKLNEALEMVLALDQAVAGGIAALLGDPEAALEPAAEDAGLTVIGHYPDYVNLAEDLKANYFSIPTEEWDAMTKAEQWAANQAFLDEAISRGDSFTLATPLDQVRPGSNLQKEVQYLTSKGYRPNGDGSALVPPTRR